jgi:asparagine synthase (glutamine-hydrolysing)
MCGIFSLLNYDSISMCEINHEFIKGQKRGPEFSILENIAQNCLFGFHRLAINGLNSASNQPIKIDGISVICNGEIYNYKQIYNFLNLQPNTGSDCEVIIHLYKKYGIEHTLTMLDGVYAFILHDNHTNNIYVARDPYGVRPLYTLELCDKNMNSNIYGFASELKCLQNFYNNHFTYRKVEQFLPGTYSQFHYSSEMWNLIVKNVPYIIPSFSHSLILNETNHESYLHDMHNKISYYLNCAVVKRCITTERPVACLLSGGLDSSLIAALVNNYYKSINHKTKLETYSIGLKGSEDLKYAKIVADYLGTNHTEIIVTEDDMFNEIPNLIYAIESYDTTTVRASIGNYLLGKYISKNSDAKVIFNGDGSDELLGGYLYMGKCPDDFEFDKETRRLLKDIYLFDVLRSDKSISSHGLEPRTPFLDKTFVNYILSIPPYFRNHKNANKCEKYILRQSFTNDYFKTVDGRQILPDVILWRKKEAFSDGVSSQGRSLFQILQEKIANYLSSHDLTGNFTNCEPNIDNEKYYYKKIFDENYPNCSHILPYFWMPKYTNATDPSARTLEIYHETPIQS